MMGPTSTTIVVNKELWAQAQEAVKERDNMKKLLGYHFKVMEKDGRTEGSLYKSTKRAICDHNMEPNTTMNFMSCTKCQKGLEEGLDKMPEEVPDLY